MHRHHYREAERVKLPPIRIFDTVCASYCQIPAGVLSKLRLLASLDDIGRRWAFRAEPAGFEDVIRAHVAQGYFFDTLVVAAIELVQKRWECPELLDHLAGIGICEPAVYRTKMVPPFPQAFRMSGVPGSIYEPHAVPDFEVTWSDRKTCYDDLRQSGLTLMK
ncbi:MAG: hypothetical protein AAF409_00710 [Pseudomonadota bacterium]